MSSAQPRFTYEDLQQMPEDGRRYELLEGVIVTSPAPKTRHQRIVRHITELLIQAENAGYGMVLTALTDVLLNPEEAVLQPDLIFVTTSHQNIVGEDHVDGPPDLVVEVLSDATRRRDLGAKLRTYARYGVPFYWVADPDEECVREYRHDGAGYGDPVFLRAGVELSCPLFPGTTMEITKVFRR